mgnify:FL=1
MTMAREKAIETLENHTQYYVPIQDLSALKRALTALRGPTREMVERMRGEWIHDGPKCEGGTDWYRCSKCGAKESDVYAKYNFCSHCGAPMTDEAVGMMLERWKEAFNNA